MEPTQQSPIPPTVPTETEMPIVTPPVSTPTSAAPVVTPINSEVKKGNGVVYFFALLVFLALAAGIAYVMINRSKVSRPATAVTAVTPLPTPISSPGPTPLTTSNVDATLGNTDTSMQQSIDQANNDLNQVNSVNTSQDNTN